MSSVPSEMESPTRPVDATTGGRLFDVAGRQYDQPFTGRRHRRFGIRRFGSPGLDDDRSHRSQ